MLYEVIQGSWKWPHFLDSMPLVSLLYLTTEGASVCPEFSHFMDLSLPFWVRTATVHIPSVWAPLSILSLELIFCVTKRWKLVKKLNAVWGHSRVMKVAWHFLDSMTPCIFTLFNHWGRFSMSRILTFRGSELAILSKNWFSVLQKGENW